MDKLSQCQKVIILVLTISIMILCSLLIYMSSIIEENSTEDEEVALVNTASENKDTLTKILDKYKVELLERSGTKIYVKFSRNLFNEDGTDNKEYFYKLINELSDHLKATYYLIDEENEINIKVFYLENENPIVRINNQENFFESSSAETYYGIDNVEIVGSKNIIFTNYYLQSLSIAGMKYSSITDKLGEPELVDEFGYEVYEGGNIKIAKYPNDNKVRNIVLSGEYLNDVVSRVKEGYSLNTVFGQYGDPAFGSVDEGYLGYRNEEFYVFFYNDEVSIYGYSYISDYKFEKYLNEYLADGDLAKFEKVTRVVWEGYHEYEYDAENESLLLTYPSKGVEINIKGNDPSGIIFYSNYYFTDDLKETIKNGDFTLNKDEDLIQKTEMKRRNNI